jgi:hypothetical protein
MISPVSGTGARQSGRSVVGLGIMASAPATGQAPSRATPSSGSCAAKATPRSRGCARSTAQLLLCATATAEQIHEAARLVAAEFVRFYDAYRAWIGRGFRAQRSD